MDEYGVHGMSAEAVRDHVDNLLKGAIGHPTQGSGEGHYFMGRPSADHVCGETGVSEEDLADLGLLALLNEAEWLWELRNAEMAGNVVTGCPEIEAWWARAMPGKR